MTIVKDVNKVLAGSIRRARRRGLATGYHPQIRNKFISKKELIKILGVKDLRIGSFGIFVDY